MFVAPGGIVSLHEGYTCTCISVSFNVGYHLLLGPVVYCPRRLLNTSTTITMTVRETLKINTMATTPPMTAAVSVLVSSEPMMHDGDYDVLCHIMSYSHALSNGGVPVWNAK